jgi:hypothetical protein
MGGGPSASLANGTYVGCTHSRPTSGFDPFITVLENHAFVGEHTKAASSFEKEVRGWFPSASYILNRDDRVEEVEQAGGT